MAFTPQNVTINAGQTVVWTNPTVVPEPHTVSFIRQQGYFPLLESPYLIANGTELPPANPAEQNTQALVIPGQFDSPNNVVVAANSRATNPVVIDAQNNVSYLQPNAHYAMTGDELYVNSGFMWPEAAIPPGVPPITSFSITFENPGTYDYVCVIHPWMTGQVIVQGDTQAETQPQTPTEAQQEPQPQPQNQTETQGLGEPESANPLFG